MVSSNSVGSQFTPPKTPLPSFGLNERQGGVNLKIVGSQLEDR